MSSDRGRGRQTALDMVRSLAVVGAAVAVYVLLVPQPEGAVEQSVDVQQVAAQSSAEADFELVVPELPEGWWSNAALLRADGPEATPTWHIGYVTPSEGYAGLEVALDATAGWVAEQTSEGRADGEAGGTIDVAGQEWALLRSTDPARASLVLERDGVTTVVTGSAHIDELRLLAEAATA